ncbi:MAG: M23 family metallopeptidase [Bacteroidetes bacterium]|nr:M23 family metallopeptidase [Bacteroidota bacterium]
MPIQGLQGKDFFIDMYIDHDPSTGIKDAFCGDKTYNGHKGTDFTLRSFKTMDSGIYVHAIADGVVLAASDGEFDRNTDWLKTGMGNFILILHEGRYRTFYGHLMKNSSKVHLGDSVKKGQVLAKVGSSGYSKGPHLHLEIYDILLMDKLVDPFAGPCQVNNSSLWEYQPIYDTASYPIEDGFTPYIPRLDSLKMRWFVSDTIYANKDTVACHWILMHGLRKQDIVKTEWLDRNGKIKMQYSDTVKENEWFTYHWNYVLMPVRPGMYLVRCFVNDKLVAIRNCYIKIYEEEQ